MPSVALPPEIRAKLYLGFAVVGVALGAIQVGYGAASVDQPTWLTVALAVYVFAGPALGLTAASNTTIPRRLLMMSIMISLPGGKPGAGQAFGIFDIGAGHRKRPATVVRLPADTLWQSRRPEWRC